ncbi:cytochrome c oxidase assembly protein [Oryzomicrobium sp.]|uniref:cytochrome c oxidase assembly protein n=1 Tax=Oryzomicrobium sp. TaxID=1911578 RepID=UPI0025F8969C|nr:cytochrome c oxidase assembly protein [Oryzomicrobium sp.]MCE1243748.1 cytochrome c oxidase assembly protein [Oryzomicrobium sp.]
MMPPPVPPTKPCATAAAMPAPPVVAAATAAANRRLVKRLLWLVAGAFAFGFALVPLYDTFCRLTGINGKTANTPAAPLVASAPASRVDLARTVSLDFVGTAMPGLPWEVRPITGRLDLHPGEVHQARFVVHNRSERSIVGQAIPSVSPGNAAQYFNKLDCFCFQQQTLAPGETRELVVTFILDPALDPDVRDVTLSYAFFIQPGPRS